MNVIGSRADGWWRDREAAMRSLVAELRALKASEGRPVSVVFDGRERPSVAEAAGREIEVWFAPRPGPDAADDEIVRLVGSGDATGVLVVTSDRRLAERVGGAGAQVIGVRAFERVLESARGSGA
ncbi:MAG: NYN domain-containing protein [Actinomycetota bacterium]